MNSAYISCWEARKIQSGNVIRNSIDLQLWIAPRFCGICCRFLCVYVCVCIRSKPIQRRLITTLRPSKISRYSGAIGLWAIVLLVSFILTAIFANQCSAGQSDEMYYIGFDANESARLSKNWAMGEWDGGRSRMNKWSTHVLYIWIHHRQFHMKIKPIYIDSLWLSGDMFVRNRDGLIIAT